MTNKSRNLALFCDFENIALGVRDAQYSRFDIEEVLERLLVKGNIVVKKAYCDWDRYKDWTGAGSRMGWSRYNSWPGAGTRVVLG